MTTTEALKKRLQNVQIAWVSSKATDAAPLRHVGADLEVVSLIGSGKDLGPEVGAFSFEERAGRRVDYDRFGWDQLSTEESAAIVAHVSELARARQVLIVPFAASQFFSNLSLSVENVHIAGNFFHLERAFNYKPWVEYELRKIGVPVVEWDNYTSGIELSNEIRGHSWLTRRSESSGGLGMLHSRSISELEKTLVYGAATDILSVAEFLDDALPLNITACVFPTGEVTVHPISIQIIGPAVCTNREFGYCGNDFGMASTVLSAEDLDEVERITISVGAWLHKFNYLGAFGIDFLKVGNAMLVSELNARFQASSHLGARLMQDIGHSDAYTDHIAAHLSIIPDEVRPSLREITTTTGQLAQIFCYFAPPNKSADDALPGVDPAPQVELGYTELLPKSEKIDDHALLFRMVSESVVLDATGKLIKDWEVRVGLQKEKVLRGLGASQ